MFYLFAITTVYSFHSQATCVETFNGLNFSEWREQVQFHLGVLDLDLSLTTEKPPALTDSSSAEQISFYKSWEKSNRLSLVFMRMTVTNNIKCTFSNTKSAKEFIKFAENCSQSDSADKSLAGTLFSTLTNMKFDGSYIMHEHVVEMTNIATRLKTLRMEVNENFIVQFIINSLPPEYNQFHMNYNTMKDEWNVNELQCMLIQEEARLKKGANHSINLMGHQRRAVKKLGKKNGKGKQ
ncbi:uncharacterized protein LOC110038957 [Phalaenopsis equestris]|uniref:uncharacterized protein LOC110038957 n=1 Tax=Phalaenopsis equestris TaxID=78828 RepID=UPI0009E60290|nr:uncharacterized protein LOC110038957 [Phalaenopsis equestris]